MSDPKPMTGPEHVKEALRLAALAEASTWDGVNAPSDERRYRMLIHAHLHASLARTAAMVDTVKFEGGIEGRRSTERQAWHDVFGVDQ